jgi:hypothetical protein
MCIDSKHGSQTPCRHELHVPHLCLLQVELLFLLLLLHSFSGKPLTLQQRLQPTSTAMPAAADRMFISVAG